MTQGGGGQDGERQNGQHDQARYIGRESGATSRRAGAPVDYAPSRPLGPTLRMATPHVEDELIPFLRGVSHAVAFWVALAAGAVLVGVVADGTRARLAALVYAVGLCALFAGSALYHRWKWDPRWRPVLRKVDHSTIFVFIASTYTPVAVLVLEGRLRMGVLLGVWAGALAGVLFSVFWITAPRWLVAGSYVLLGWVAVITVPTLLDRLPAAPLLLLGAGGLLYSVGAAVYAARRPDPWPRSFGFHEVFHALVVAAAMCHYVAMAGWIVGSAGR